MENDNRNRSENVFSRKIRAGRRRTYFFDVRTTKGNDFYLTITESKKKQTGDGYERHKIFLYKEDFNKFLEEMTTSIDYIKERMPDFDFDAFSHKYDNEDEEEGDYLERRSEQRAEDTPAPEEKPVSSHLDEVAEPMEDEKPTPSDDEPKGSGGFDPSINEDDLKW